jgi:hypothetical protein
MAADKHIVGRKADLTRHEISRHVRARRLTARVRSRDGLFESMPSVRIASVYLVPE